MPPPPGTDGLDTSGIAPRQATILMEGEMTMESTPLNGQVAVVTGGGRGIGAAVARKLAALGASTVV